MGGFNDALPAAAKGHKVEKACLAPTASPPLKTLNHENKIIVLGLRQFSGHLVRKPLYKPLVVLKYIQVWGRLVTVWLPIAPALLLTTIIYIHERQSGIQRVTQGHNSRDVRILKSFLYWLSCFTRQTHHQFGCLDHHDNATLTSVCLKRCDAGQV